MQKRIYFILFLVFASLFLQNNKAENAMGNLLTGYSFSISNSISKKVFQNNSTHSLGCDNESNQRAKNVIRTKALDNSFALDFTGCPILSFSKGFFSKVSYSSYQTIIFSHSVVLNALRGPPLA